MAASKRHKELQNITTTWIGNRSVKMIALPESNVVGYVADLVTISRMNDAVHKRYCEFSGLTAMYMSQVWQGALLPVKWIIKGYIDRHYVNVFEVKVSRSDFLSTFGGKDSTHAKARLEPVGTAHWVVAEKGICEPNELSDCWGLLEPYGSGLSEKKQPKLNILTEEEIHSFAFDMMWLSQNKRISYYDQIREMSDSIKKVHQAIFRRAPEKELLTLSVQAIKACRGMTE